MLWRIKKKNIRYKEAPADSLSYTDKMDRIYTRYAVAYDIFMKVFPLWTKWLRTVMPYLQGRDLLEVSFGPAYLLRQYPEHFQLHGIDYNQRMVDRARVKMKKINRDAELCRGNVENLPYADASFDTVVNTMAFSGYPNGDRSLDEMLRVVRPGGVLLLMDYVYPDDRNILGCSLIWLMEAAGDIVQDIIRLLDTRECGYQRKIVGGFGSIQLFIIHKNERS